MRKESSRLREYNKRPLRCNCNCNTQIKELKMYVDKEMSNIKYLVNLNELEIRARDVKIEDIRSRFLFKVLEICGIWKKGEPEKWNWRK